MTMENYRNPGTLFFTSATSTTLAIGNNFGGLSIAHQGLYSCTLKDYGGKYNENDDDYEDDGGYCIDPKKVADGRNVDVHFQDQLPLMNLQFFVSSKKRSQNEQSAYTKDESRIDSNNDDGSSYLYGVSMIEHKEHKIYSWEILRANPVEYTDADDIIDGNSTDATIHNGISFRTYFRSMDAFDWNNCEFNCCPFNDDFDSNGIKAHRDRHDNAYMHAYVRASPRSFAVDSNTGDVFIVWEGFYKNCNPADMFYAPKILEWTVGVSRLKTHDEDPTCVLPTKDNGETLGFEDLHNNFSRCTVPVAIVFKGTHGREVVLPRGGFAVIPAAIEGLQQENQKSNAKGNSNDSAENSSVKPRRTFLLTVFQQERGETKSKVWAFPEGGDVTRNLYQRQEVTSTAVDGIMESGVWNGGNLRLHYNRQTGRPDHLCRTLFNKGIVCMPITVTEDINSVYVKVSGETETFLKKIQVKSFCVPGDEVPKEDLGKYNYRKKSNLVTGLDILWNEQDGTPDRIFFGCWGGIGNGKVGSVDWGGKNLVQMLQGAYAGDVILLPPSLDPTAGSPLTASYTSRTASSNSTIQQSESYTVTIVAVLVVCVSSYIFYKRRFGSLSSFRSFHPATGNRNFENRNNIPNTYMELPVIGSSDAMLS